MAVLPADVDRALVRVRDLAGRPRGTGFLVEARDGRGTLVTSHEAVDGLVRLVLHAHGEQTTLVEAHAITPLPELGLALVATEGLDVPPLPVAGFERSAGPGRAVRLRGTGWVEAAIAGTAPVTYTATDRFHLLDAAYELMRRAGGRRAAARRGLGGAGDRRGDRCRARCRRDRAARGAARGRIRGAVAGARAGRGARGGAGAQRGDRARVRAAPEHRRGAAADRDLRRFRGPAAGLARGRRAPRRGGGAGALHGRGVRHRARAGGCPRQWPYDRAGGAGRAACRGPGPGAHGVAAGGRTPRGRGGVEGGRGAGAGRRGAHRARRDGAGARTGRRVARCRRPPGARRGAPAARRAGRSRGDAAAARPRAA